MNYEEARANWRTADMALRAATAQLLEVAAREVSRVGYTPGSVHILTEPYGARQFSFTMGGRGYLRYDGVPYILGQALKADGTPHRGRSPSKFDVDWLIAHPVVHI